MRYNFSESVLFSFFSRVLLLMHKCSAECKRTVSLSRKEVLLARLPFMTIQTCIIKLVNVPANYTCFSQLREHQDKRQSLEENTSI